MSTSTASSTISVNDILRNALDGVFVVDRQRRFILFNEACERITGFSGSELVGAECHCRDVLDCRDEYQRPLSSGLCPVKSLFDGTGRSARQRMCLRRKNGTPAWVETVYTPVDNGAGQTEFVLGIIRDITEAKSHEAHLLEQIRGLRQRLSTLAPGEPLGLDNESGREAEPLRTAGCRTSFSEWNDAPASPTTETAGDPILSLDPILADVERDAIRRALRSAKWQRNKAAQLMGISRSRLYRRMEALGIDPNERR